MLNNLDEDDWILLTEQEKQEPNHDYWNILLPDECVLEIFSNITEPISLLSACCTCRQWNYLGDCEKLWELFIKRAKTNKLVEYVGAQEAKLLEYYPAKERYIKIFMKGSMDKQSSNKLQLILEKTEVRMTRDEDTLQGELVATIYDDTLTIGGVFVYLSMSEYFFSFCHLEHKRKNNVPLLTEVYWKIPYEDPLIPLDPNFSFHPIRHKISQYTQIQPHLLHKGTYHWPFLLKIPALPPTVDLQKFPKFIATIKHSITGMIYGVPGGILSKMFSDRLVESRSIIFRYLEYREMIMGKRVKEQNPNRKIVFKNGWMVLLDKSFYVIGEVVTLFVDFSLDSVFLTPQSLWIELNVWFTYKGETFFLNIDKQKYPEVIPENQLKHKFQLQFRLSEKISDCTVGPLFIWPSKHLRNSWKLVLHCGNYKIGVTVPILIVNDNV